MFTRQKKNYRVFVYTALIITVCLLAAALLWRADDPAAGTEAAADTAAETEKQEKEEIPPADEPADSEKNEEDVNERGITQNSQSYYIVRRDGDVISVFFVSPDGEEVRLEDTDIIYELLPPEDQNSFDEGIKAESQDQLASLLQDFES